MLRCFALFVMLACTGCVSLSIPVYVAEDEPEALVLTTADAVAWWNAELGVDAFSLRVVPSLAEARAALDGFAVVVTTTDDIRLNARSKARTTHLLGVQYIRVETQATDPDHHGISLPYIVTHELGHALGLRHADEPGNLMRKSSKMGSEAFGLTDRQLRRARTAVGFALAL